MGLVYPRPPSRNPVGPTAPPEENGHFLLCDLVDVPQLPSWPTVSSTGMLGRGPPRKPPPPLVLLQQPWCPHLPSFVFSLFMC